MKTFPSRDVHVHERPMPIAIDDRVSEELARACRGLREDIRASGVLLVDLTGQIMVCLVITVVRRPKPPPFVIRPARPVRKSREFSRRQSADRAGRRRRETQGAALRRSSGFRDGAAD